ncbi:lysophospholipid acyltransferase 1-like isoform X1 [Acipenser oxyrinchus oxyrinchus]|uniref:Lysophospholipid acyltransferase 1-like isoform X1 n=1 Tax=Acipenser oxyrinchus oxyrinchus TaxID=40147 RepID=A0AAD8LS30_ACIOX|nr:lysophospholipid acyltransferase 1-like isoform X1 [Acipenser oxyrinchus oxyrinchus]
MAEPNIPFRTTGSKLLHPVSELLGVPLDQVNFLACQLCALLAAFWFRLYLSPNKASTTIRHAVSTLLGAYFAIFCFGWYSLHIFTMVSICYCIMLKASIQNLHRYSVIAAMGYLILCQISRVYIFNYGLLSTDFSGPLMIITQKITTVAFQVHDGLCKKDEELTSEQQRLAVKARPTLLEYLSYNLNFLSILAGPCSNYKDYIAFIEGRHIAMKPLERNRKPNGYSRLPEPSPAGAIVYKLCITTGSLILFLSLTKAFPIVYIADDKFINEASFLARLSYAYIAMQAARPKYYFAWTLADAINNAAGYGFNGIDTQGQFRWDLISNLNIWNIETATSFKMYIDNWNIQTAAWLKRVCYDRAPHSRTAFTFFLSAVWHGVYPGYYFTFITAVPITLAARAMRNNFRHHFLSSRTKKVIYDIITWAVTQLSICYTVAPFLLLAVEPTFKFYKSMYFCFHILSILVLLVLPIKPNTVESQVHTSSNNKENGYIRALN